MTPPPALFPVGLCVGWGPKGDRLGPNGGPFCVRPAFNFIKAINEFCRSFN